MSRALTFCAILCRSHAFLALAVAVWSLMTACRSGAVDGDGSGGSTGGTVSDGGTAGDGGFGGLVGAGGSGASGGSGGTLPLCDLPMRIDARPFEIELGDVLVSPSDHALGGQGGAGESGCQVMDDDDAWLNCEGLAQVSAGASGPVLELGDGTTFSWRLEDFDAGALAEETVVWLEYTEDEWVICPVCGVIPWQSLVVRDADDATKALVYWSFDEHIDVTNSPLSDILGVEVAQVPACAEPGGADCYLDVTTTHYDVVLGGPSNASISPGDIAPVTTPLGSFELYSYLYGQSGTRDPNCYDGRGLQFGGPMLVIRQ